MVSSTSDTQPPDGLEAALEYARLGWPVIPGAVWHEGRFVDPNDGQPTASVTLRPVGSATTDPELIRSWWSESGLHVPTVLGVVGHGLGVVSVYESLVDCIVDHQWFATRPTPVLGIPGMPLAYFLVRPPVPLMLARDEVRVLADGTTLPLPPAALGDTAATWLVSPADTGNVVLLGDEFAGLVAAAGERAA